MDGIASFIEKEINWCEQHVNCADADPSSEFKSGFIAGLKQVQDFINDNQDSLIQE